MPTLDQSASAMLAARSSRAESAAWTASGERNKARIPTSTLRDWERMGDLVREITVALPHRATERLCPRVGSSELRKRSAARRKRGNRARGALEIRARRDNQRAINLDWAYR